MLGIGIICWFCFAQTTGQVAVEDPRSSPQRPIENAYFGDMVLNEAQIKAVVKERKDSSAGTTDSSYAGITDTTKRWTNGVIPYEIDCSIENIPDAVDSIKKAMAEWERKTCIRFVKKTNEKVALTFFRDTHCWGNVGMVSYSRISVGYGCEYQHVMTHEIGHVVGFYHEQNRLDRDSWVKVHWENIGQFKDAFDKVKGTADYGVPYDYESIMHYPWTAFSSNGKITMSAIRALGNKKPYIALSRADALQTSRMYQCSRLMQQRERARKIYHEGEIKDAAYAGDCVNKNRHCDAWARGGYCSSSDYVRENCKKACKSPSCNGGGSNCRDKDQSCPAWAKANYCNLASVIKLCPLSCNLCGGPQTNPPVTQPPVTQPPITNNPVTQPPGTKPGTQIPVTQGPTTKPDVNRNFLGTGILCIDTHNECSRYVQSGECTRNPGWMKANCMLSCKRRDPNFAHCDYRPKQPSGQCTTPLGLGYDGTGRFKLPDSAFYSPANLVPGAGWVADAKNARLYWQDDFDTKRIGGWCAESHEQAKDPSKGYVQVDLGRSKRITYIATQGRNKYFERIGKFKIGYSNDGRNFRYYQENGQDKTFIGNCDHVSPVLNQFRENLQARYIRYYPVEWNYPCLRMELYGC